MRLRSLRSADPECSSIAIADGLTVVDWLSGEEREDAVRAMQWLADQQATQPRPVVLRAFQVPVEAPAVTEADVAGARVLQAEASGRLAEVEKHLRTQRDALDATDRRRSSLATEVEASRRALEPLAEGRFEQANAELKAMHRRFGVRTDGTIHPRQLLESRLVEVRSECETLEMAISIARSVDVEELRREMNSSEDTHHAAVAVLASVAVDHTLADSDASDIEATAREWLEALEEASSDLSPLEAHLADRFGELALLKQHIEDTDPDLKIVVGVDPALQAAIDRAEVAERRLASHLEVVESLASLVALSDEAQAEAARLTREIETLELARADLEAARTEALEDLEVLKAQHEIDRNRVSVVVSWVQASAAALADWEPDAPCTVILDGVFDQTSSQERQAELRSVLSLEDQIQIIVFSDDQRLADEVVAIRASAEA